MARKAEYLVIYPTSTTLYVAEEHPEAREIKFPIELDGDLAAQASALFDAIAAAKNATVERPAPAEPEPTT